MSLIEIGFLLLVFCSVFGLALAALRMVAGGTVRARLDAIGVSETKPVGGAPSWLPRFVAVAAPVAKLSLPENDEEISAVRVRFMNAGFRQASAPIVFFAIKTVLTLVLPMCVFTVLSLRSTAPGTTAMLAYVLCGAAAGYYLPNMLLRNATQRRQREIFESFPDALDLMTICVEAGLGMDAALARVAGEISLKSAVLAEELNLVTLALRAGSSKEKALRDLGTRTGVEDVDALVALLIQAERFGTSIAASLRVQSEQLRTKRRQRAEEQAAKIALKLLFPLIFFIFPSLLVVLMGPAFIQIYRVLLPTFSGAH
ncbi:type II secretion system protein [Massilia sp. WF1]|uniref:type II secretion system F family protein n=1 Tax=unclassified Massilia TaxID=2609279 RepID=UPI00064A35D8|nr:MULTISPECIES: type II secretion system F family protein [unclassified Massilia]ALK97858.1 type II secretion system protein [Massilia sp. WG5]KLU35796.1 type II secretion system protein [Massilia sp. WF1]